MALFDAWSGSDEAEQAAAKNAALYQQYGIDTSNLYGGYRTDATGALTGAKGAALGALGEGLSTSTDLLRQGLAGAADAGRASVAAYAPLSALGENYGRGVNRYMDALGLNGPGAAQRAQSTYMASPGVQYQINEATRAGTNAASRTGNVGGGSTALAITNAARGATAQDYGTQYLDRLAGFINPQLQATAGAASGIAGANKTLADIYTQGYGGLAGAYGQNATQRAALESGFGSDLTNVFGNATAGQAQSLKDVTAGNAQANRDVAAAGQTDASNLWGLLGAGVGAAGKAFAPRPGA